MQRVRQYLKCWNPAVCPHRRYSYPVSFHHLLRNQPSPQFSKLENGLTVVTEERDACNVCMGVFLDAGARYESSFENGIAHFFEHLAFKGTNARTRTVLEQQMGATGARFDCVTTRELVGYRAQCLAAHAPLCVDLLSDCVFNNSYSEPDIELQKKVVYLEMRDRDCDPNAVLEDYLHATAYQGTPLAQTVMGPSCNLYNFNAMTISRYMNKYYDANRTVFAAVGAVSHEHMLDLAESYMSKLEPSKCIDNGVYRYTGSEVRARDDSLPAATVALAVEAPPLCDADLLPMEVAAEVIGGWDRSQGGGYDHAYPVARAASAAQFCDAYGAFYIKYKDTGLWGVKLVGPSLKLEDILGCVQEEWMNLCNTVTEGEVARAKRVLKCKILSEGSECGRWCAAGGRWALYEGFWPSLADRVAAVERVHAAEVRAVCQRYLYDRCPAVAAVGPTEGLPDYTRIRAGMYWLRI